MDEGRREGESDRVEIWCVLIGGVFEAKRMSYDFDAHFYLFLFLVARL
jgi:hypothetical protein